MQWLIGITFAVLIALSVALPGPAAAATPGALLGVFYGNQGWKMDQVRAMEAWQQKRNAVVVLFTNWDTTVKTQKNLFEQQLMNIWGSGNVPLITWEPFLRTTTPANIEVQIAAGAYDAYILEWGGRLKAFLSGPDGALGTADDRRAYLRLAHEMNGDWYPWSASTGVSTPADYVAMWRRVHGLVSGLGLGPAQLQWVWSVNHTDNGPFTAEQYFPGDAYLDWVGIDGYNWGATQPWSAWATPEATFGPMLARVRALSSKPLTIAETAATSLTSAGPSVAQKSAWVTALFGWATTNGVGMLCWFNTDKETDWGVFDGASGDESYRYGRTTYKAYSAYRNAVASPALLPADKANPRLLTDAQFRGW